MPRDARLLSSSCQDECKLEENLMSGTGRGKKMKGSVASGRAGGSSTTGVGQEGRLVGRYRQYYQFLAR